MNRVVAVLSLAALASAQQLTWMCRPYAFMKVMESCVGKAAVEEKKMMMMTSVRDTCLSRPTVWDNMMGDDYNQTDDMMPGMMGDMMPGMMGDMLPDMMGDMMKPGMKPGMGDMKPGMGDMKPGMDDMMPGMMGNMMDEMMNGIMGMMDGMKAGMMLGPEMAPILSNITCIMQEMKWMDEKDMPNPKGMKKMIQSLNLNPFLTMTMKKDIDTCAKQSMCSMDMDSPFGPKISKMMNFMKCVGYKMFACCAMNEMMLNLPMGPMSDGPMDDVTKMAGMAAHMAQASQKNQEEVEKEATFMMIMQTMFGPMSPFMQ